MTRLLVCCRGNLCRGRAGNGSYFQARRINFTATFTMKRIILLLLFIASFFVPSQAQLNWGWAKSVGGSGDDHFKKIVTDSRNGVYAFGSFKSTAFTVGSTPITNAGGSDLLLVKYDTLGNVVWAKSFGSTGDDTAYSIATDRSSNVLIAGSFKNSIAFGSTTLTSSGGNDAFFVKLSSSGTVIWAKQLTGSLDEMTEVIKPDIYNNIYLAGRYKSNDLNMGGQVFTAPGTSNVFYCKLDSNGNFIWRKTNASNCRPHRIYNIQFSNSNNTTVALEGSIEGLNTASCTVKFNPGPIPPGITASLPTTFEVKIDSAGTFISEFNITSTRDWAGGTGVLPGGRMLYSGYHSSSLNSTLNATAGKWGLNGPNAIAHVFASPNSVGNELLSSDMVIDRNYRLFSIGAYLFFSPGGSANFGNGYIITGGAASTSGIFVWQLDTSFITQNLLSAVTAPFPSSLNYDHKLSGLALDTITNSMYAAGYLTAPVNTNNTIGSNTLVSAGLSDGVIVKITADPVGIPPLTISAGADITICLGNSVTIGAAGGATGGVPPYAYSWSPTTGLSNPTSSLTTATPTVTTSYVLTVTDAAVQVAKDTIVVTVNPGPLPPTPSITPNGPTSFCAGGSVTLTSSSTGATGYLWSTGATTQSIVVSAAGNYTVQTINSGGCISNSSLPTTITVNTPATPVITPSGPTSFCPGGSVTLTSSAANAYLWSTGAITQSITVNTAGSYTVTITNSFGCTATSAPVTITVNPQPPTPVITPPGPVVLCPGILIGLSSSAISGNLWSNGSTTQTTYVNTAGSYSVTVTNGFGCSSAPSAPAIVIINPAPPAPVITASGPTTFCQGGSVTLTSSVATGNVWSTGATTQSITVTTSGFYTVTVSNGLCTSTSAGTRVTVNPNPPVPVITQNGNNLVSSATSGNQWYLNNVVIPGATAQTYTYQTGGQYSVRVTGSTGCYATSLPFNALHMRQVTLKNGDVFQYTIHPNPVNQTANVSYILKSAVEVSVSVVGGSGNRLLVLQEKKLQAAGAYTINFSSMAERLNTGLNFIVFEVDGKRIAVKFIKTR